jgi:tight adherence protein C
MSGELLLMVLAVFCSVALLTGSIASFLLEQGAPVRRRLRGLTRSEADGSQRAPSLTQPLSPVIERFRRVVPKSPHELGRLRRRLSRAGLHGLTPAVVYRLAELGIPVIATVVILLVVPLRQAALAALVAGLAGYLLPGLTLQWLMARRHKVIRNGLPDALDLFIVCLEAGSSLDQAIVKASEELHLPYQALAEEFTMMTTEIRAGKPRLEAFRNFSERTGVDDVRALVAMLIQTDRFGTSVAQALRAHADTARTKRRQRAEERAEKVGVKLVFPLVFCLFPGFFVVTVGPAVIQFVRIFFGQVVNQ